MHSYLRTCCSWATGLALLVASQASSAHPHLAPVADIHAGDTAWLLTSTALVLLMTLPGVALFYGGMVRTKNVLNTMACVLAISALVTVEWWLLGYSLAFTPGSGWLGGTERFWFAGLDFIQHSGQVAVSHIAPHVPESVYGMFQLAFGVITTALIVGAFVERMRFGPMLVLMGLWFLLVYAPVAHWVWEPGGWLAQLGVLDFAGGSVVHINAGISGLVIAAILGRREGYGKEPFRPFNLGLTMTGACLLWIGWFGFNAGSALAADGRAGLAMAATHTAAACGVLGWMLAEWLVKKTPTLLGMSSGAIAGLVAITPASGYVGIGSAAAIGAIGGVACFWGATWLKHKLGVDDSLDVFGVHGIGGLAGSLLTGVFNDPAISGQHTDLATQAMGAGAVLAYSACVTALLTWIVQFGFGLRVSAGQEHYGLDLTTHHERIGD